MCLLVASLENDKLQHTLGFRIKCDHISPTNGQPLGHVYGVFDGMKKSCTTSCIPNSGTFYSHQHL